MVSRSTIDAATAKRLSGMSISQIFSEDSEVETSVVGRLADQIALSRVLNTLYGLHLPIIVPRIALKAVSHYPERNGLGTDEKSSGKRLSSISTSQGLNLKTAKFRGNHSTVLLHTSCRNHYAKHAPAR